MKCESVTFLCDVSRCTERLTVITEDRAEAYIEMGEKGWKVRRNVVTGWKHVCPDHAFGDLS